MQLALEEVVILGSSVTQSRRALGNAVTTVQAESMQKVTPWEYNQCVASQGTGSSDNTKLRGSSRWVFGQVAWTEYDSRLFRTPLCDRRGRCQQL